MLTGVRGGSDTLGVGDVSGRARMRTTGFTWPWRARSPPWSGGARQPRRRPPRRS